MLSTIITTTTIEHGKHCEQNNSHQLRIKHWLHSLFAYLRDADENCLDHTIFVWIYKKTNNCLFPVHKHHIEINENSVLRSDVWWVKKLKEP